MKEIARATVISCLTTPDKLSFETKPVPGFELDFGGIPGDRHYGLTRPAGGREKYFTKGTEIRNRRQLSILAVDEINNVAEKLQVDPKHYPEWIGANLVLEGLENLTQLPAGAAMLFASGAALNCEGENAPCRFPGDLMKEHYPEKKSLHKEFVVHANGLRGLVASVEKVGWIKVGDVVVIFG